MTPARLCRLGASALWLVLVSGCSDGNPRAAVAGKVTLDRTPLEAGSISLQPIEGTQGPTAGAVISNGTYAIQREKGPLPGVYRVEIRAQRKTGKKIPAGSPAPPGTLVDEVVEAIPARYHSASTLRAEVHAGSNQIDFELSSE